MLATTVASVLNPMLWDSLVGATRRGGDKACVHMRACAIVYMYLMLLLCMRIQTVLKDMV